MEQRRDEVLALIRARDTRRRMPPTASLTARVGFDETDAQGVVYYGRYMPYFDRARVEYLRHLGLLLPAGDPSS